MWIECVKSEQTKTEWKACKQQWMGLKHKSDTFCTFFSASSSPGRVLLVKKAAASLITRNIFYSFHFTDSEALCNKFPSIYFYILLSFCTMSIIDFYVFFLVFAGCFCGSLFMLWEKLWGEVGRRVVWKICVWEMDSHAKEGMANPLIDVGSILWLIFAGRLDGFRLILPSFVDWCQRQLEWNW